LDGDSRVRRLVLLVEVLVTEVAEHVDGERDVVVALARGGRRRERRPDEPGDDRHGRQRPPVPPPVPPLACHFVLLSPCLKGGKSTSSCVCRPEAARCP